MKNKVHPVNAIVPSAYIIFKGSFQSGSLGQAELRAEANPVEGTVTYQQAVTQRKRLAGSDYPEPAHIVGSVGY